MSEGPLPAPQATSKADPEALALRGQPPRVTRFRRNVIVGASGLAAVVICGVAWLALWPETSESRGADEDAAPAAAPKLPDMIADAPDGYGDAPRLGPKLPGDLGRPILKHRRDLDMARSEGADDAAARAAEAAEAERLRLAAEQRAALESEILIRRSRNPVRSGTAPPLASRAAETPTELPEVRPGGPLNNDPAFRAKKRDTTSVHGLVEPPSPWTVQAGSVISASLITGLNSDLPGLVTAQITANVYDSVTGRTLLIPQGSRLIGSYDNVVTVGQTRALVVWRRVILPDGSSIRIDNMPASDTEGYAGLADRVDHHTWRLLKGVALSSLLGVGGEAAWGSDESDLVRAIRESTQREGTSAADKIVSRNLDIQPTLKIRPGWPLRIVVNEDLVLRPWDGGEGERG